ncbi:hypothetical protein AB4274_21245 [Vibrio sp. 10N.261.55.A10]|uniref:hypothetical protein n=1 Tax=Vibrio sp. 10N.261.55.A10 TaxID=3229687 RepID=UPI00355217D7
MSPIDKVVESDFTTSSKGLLTLFIIGVIKLVIGIEFTSNTISIPWLPTVEFTSLDNIIFLYWFLVGYAIFRYSLHHLPSYRKLKFEALAEALKPGNIGNNFVQEYIFPGAKIYSCDIETPTTEGNKPKIRIDIRDSDGGLASRFEFVYSLTYKLQYIEGTINPEFNSTKIDAFGEKVISFWGLFNYVDEDGYDTYKTQVIRNPIALIRLKLFTFIHYVKILFSDLRVFDLSFPIILNLGLFFYWLPKLENLILPSFR